MEYTENNNASEVIVGTVSIIVMVSVVIALILLVSGGFASDNGCYIEYDYLGSTVGSVNVVKVNRRLGCDRQLAWFDTVEEAVAFKAKVEHSYRGGDGND